MVEFKKGDRRPEPEASRLELSDISPSFMVNDRAHTSALFEYIGRPTKPEMLAARPRRSNVGGSGATPDESAASRASSQPVRLISDDCEARPTLRPAPAQAAAAIQPAETTGITGTLTRFDGPDAGRVTALRGLELTIGRSLQADLHLAEATVSRMHARVHWADGMWVLEDLESQNGTFVWGKPVSTVELRQGDLIRAGPIATLRFCWMDEHQQDLLERLYESSVCDALTGAFNRRHFAARLEAELAYARRHQVELSLLLLDVDHFKAINDGHGHAAGDRVLRDVTRTCQRRLRTEDTFARYGGEEFAVLLRGVPLRGAARAAERLREGIAARVIVGPPALPVSVSVGCASLACLENASGSELIRLADRRLYRAKQLGRGRVVADGELSSE